MESLQAIMNTFKMDVLKEPRGFMKILQFFFTICAFATTTSFSAILAVGYTCNGSQQVANIPIEYNFKLSQQSIPACNSTNFIFSQDFSSDSGFFVTVGVLAFLLTIAILIVYCFLSVLYEVNPLYPLADCVLHGIFAILFLACSSAWANSLSGLKSATNIDTINAVNTDICDTTCTINMPVNYSKLNISIIFGFLNCFLFGSNVWFLYKETAIFKEKQAQKQTIQQTQA